MFGVLRCWVPTSPLCPKYPDWVLGKHHRSRNHGPPREVATRVARRVAPRSGHRLQRCRPRERDAYVSERGTTSSISWVGHRERSGLRTAVHMDRVVQRGSARITRRGCRRGLVAVTLVQRRDTLAVAVRLAGRTAEAAVGRGVVADGYRAVAGAG